MRKLPFAAFLALMLFCAFWPTKDAARINLDNAFGGISSAHPLGTDNLGRDMFSMLIKGGWRTMTAIGVSTAISFFCGISLGILAGYYKGAAESIIILIADFTLVLPSFICALIFSGLFGMNPFTAGLVFGAGGIGEYINQASSMTKGLRNIDFIECEIVMGISDVGILLRHILPNILRPLLTFMANKAANVSLQYAALTYIGLGCDISEPDWGTMLYQYRVFTLSKPFLVLCPTLAISLMALLLHVIFDSASPRGLHEATLYD